jgi:hypothetical protein
MTEAGKHSSSRRGDGDATDAEVNRKLTEHLRENALQAEAHAAMEPAGEPPIKGGFSPFASSMVNGIGSTIFHAAILAAIVILMTVAALYAYLYEKEAN